MMFNFCRTNAYRVKREIDICINIPFYIYKGGFKLILNLQQDYKKIIIKEIKQSGLKIPKDYDDDHLIIMYYSYLRKLAFAGPHKIVKSKDFTCPPDVIKGFKKLENIIEIGGDITPYFNRWASNLSKYDDLFADWGILHFHLGDEFIEGEHFVKRGDPVLFAYLDQETVYFIDIYMHGHWADSKVIQKMYDNWPALVSKFILKGIDALEFTYDQDQLKQLRKNGITTPVEIKDKKGKNIVLMSPGMGVTAARSSLYDVSVYSDVLNKLGRLELFLASDERGLKELMKSQGVYPKGEISLELIGINQKEILLLDKRNWFPLKLSI